MSEDRIVQASHLTAGIMVTLILVQLGLLVALMTQISDVQKLMHEDIEIHRCRNEEVHRQIMDAIRTPYSPPPIDCRAVRHGQGKR